MIATRALLTFAALAAGVALAAFVTRHPVLAMFAATLAAAAALTVLRHLLDLEDQR